MQPATLTEFEQEKAHFQKLVDTRVGYVTETIETDFPEAQLRQILTALMATARPALLNLGKVQNLREGGSANELTTLMDNLAGVIGEIENILR